MTNQISKSILLLSANPRETNSLRLQEEEREIRERLRLAGYGKTPINSTGATRTRDIQQAMLDFKPQIVHFSGHGAEKEGLVFEDALGQEKLVGSSALANLFRLFNRVECVILNACYSKFQAEGIARNIEYVIGMNQGIGDRAAIEFSVGFYSALGAGESIEFAYELGCNAIQLEGLPDHLTPVLYKKGKLLQIYIGNRVLKDDEAENISSPHENEPDLNLVRNFVSEKSKADKRLFETIEIEGETQSQPETSQELNQNIRYEEVSGLIEKLFGALSEPDTEVSIKKFKSIVHKSLFHNNQLKASFRKNCFEVARIRYQLYKYPVEILQSEPTGRTRIGTRGMKEKGIEQKIIVCRKNLGQLNGYIRIFFPENNGSAKISGLSL